jgi:hypothetical protein
VERLADMPDIILACLNAMESGRTRDDILRLLHAKGLSIADSTKVLMKVYDMTLRDAKDAVDANPVWREVVEAARPLHDVLATSEGDGRS